MQEIEVSVQDLVYCMEQTSHTMYTHEYSVKLSEVLRKSGELTSPQSVVFALKLVLVVYLCILHLIVTCWWLGPTVLCLVNSCIHQLWISFWSLGLYKQK